MFNIDFKYFYDFSSFPVEKFASYADLISLKL